MVFYKSINTAIHNKYNMSSQKITIIVEKPSVAQQFAKIFDNIKPQKSGAVTYYKAKQDNEEILIFPAAGHLYTLTANGNKTFPQFNVRWAPLSEVSKGAEFSEKFLKTIIKYGGNADIYINACDYDIEGSVIGNNILIQGLGAAPMNIKRMKYSTLTKGELTKAFQNLENFDRKMTESGVVRHIVDWYYGINVSRSLMDALAEQRKADPKTMYTTLSAGRVQTPALAILVKREKEIIAFIPQFYWQVKLLLDGFSLFFMYEEDKIWDKAEAKKIIDACKGKFATIASIEKKEKDLLSPTPFNLTDLQMEAYGVFGFVPSQTQQIAQELYIATYISYPRTSSQKLPATLGLRNVIQQIALQNEYNSLCAKLLAMPDLKPNEGKKEDLAHPAIYPTGEFPKSLTTDQKKLYDLIVKRFLATFGEPAIRESTKIVAQIEDYKFLLTLLRTKKQGWLELYMPYSNLKEDTQVVSVEKGELVTVKDINLEEKQTEPPKRYSQASFVKELEKKGLGTKATRAEIVRTLYNRKYIENTSQIGVTKLGIVVEKVLEEYIPTLIDENMTADLQQKLEDIQINKISDAEVLEASKVHITNAIRDFSLHKLDIGKELKSQLYEARQEATNFGKCKCSGDLVLKRSRFGQFVGCSNYPNCKQTSSLPKSALIQKTEKLCEKCGFPAVTVVRKGKRPFTMCLNSECETRVAFREKYKEYKNTKRK